MSAEAVYIEDLLGMPTIDVQGIPPSLKQGKAWCCWRYETRGGKPTKMPVRPDGSTWKSNDPTTWVTFDEALAGFDTDQFDGIGRVLDGDLVGVDLDWKHADPSTLGPDGAPSWLPRVLETLGSWTESSPSQKGVHVWLRGQWKGGKHQYPLSIAGHGVEVFNHTSPRFFTVTGNTYPSSPTEILTGEAAQAALDVLARELDGLTKQKTTGNAKPHDGPDFKGAPEGMRRAALTSEAGRLRALGTSRAEAHAVLMALAGKCQPPVPEDHVAEILSWAWSKPAGEPRCPVCDSPEPCPDHLAAPPAEGGLSTNQVVLVCAATIAPKTIEWLWYPRLAIGAVTWLEGPPEKGKSAILLDLAARVSRGDHMPGVGHEPEREPGNVIILAGGEDAIADTMVPRLIAAGAELDRVHFLTATRDEKGKVVPFRLSDDAERLARSAREMGAKLIVIDPLVCFMGSRLGRRVDSNNDLEVRQALAPLSEIDASIVAIRHYRKAAGTDPLAAGGGSVAFTAVTRIALAALADPENPERNLLCVSKNNLVPTQHKVTLSYETVSSAADPSVVCVRWGEAVDASASDVLLALSEKATGGAQLESAVSFLEDALADGPVRSDDVFTQGAAKHISRRTLWRAKGTMPKIHAHKVGAVWYWQLDADEPHDGAPL